MYDPIIDMAKIAARDNAGTMRTIASEMGISVGTVLGSIAYENMRLIKNLNSDHANKCMFADSVTNSIRMTTPCNEAGHRWIRVNDPSSSDYFKLLAINIKRHLSTYLRVVFTGFRVGSVWLCMACSHSQRRVNLRLLKGVVQDPRLLMFCEAQYFTQPVRIAARAFRAPGCSPGDPGKNRRDLE